MTPVQYFKEILSTMPEIARLSGYSTLRLYGEFLRCYLLKRSTLEEFRILELYKYSNTELSNFLTLHQLPKLQRILNAGATEEEIVSVYSKHTFNTLFEKFVHREWLYLPHSSEEDIRHFLQRNGRCLLKPVDGFLGSDIHLIDGHNDDIDLFLRKHRRDNSVLESFIQQHPAMAECNPTSVNTIRIITARMGSRVHVVGAALRCGEPGAIVDNFHSGGSAYPVDAETGIVLAPGRTLRSAEPLFFAPGTEKVMPGFPIPHWDLLLEEVTKAALVPSHLGYLAWDIAVTPDGVDFVEVNVTTPGTNIIQLNGGVYKKLRNFLKS